MLSRLYIKHSGYAKASSCAPATLKLHITVINSCARLFSKVLGESILSIKTRIRDAFTVFVYTVTVWGRVASQRPREERSLQPN